MSDVDIRQRQATDLAGCVEALALVHRSDEYPMHWPTDPTAFLVPSSPLPAWIAVTRGPAGVDEVVVGHLVLCHSGPESDRVAQVNRLFVTPAARGHKAGFRLLQAARDWALSAGYSLELEVVTHAPAAIALYEGSGWQRIDTVVADWAPAGSGIKMHRYVLPAA
jgi:GNAT superfamily N-acetyltransferase